MMESTSLLSDNWRELINIGRRRARFDVEKEFDGNWQVVDVAYGKRIAGFGTNREAIEYKSFFIAYVKRWGDIDFYSFPSNMEVPLYYGDENAIREWWDEHMKQPPRER